MRRGAFSSPLARRRADEGGADVFAHYSAIESSGYRSLEENQRVEFEIAQGPKGLQAENIRPL